MSSLYKPVRDLTITLKPSNQQLKCHKELQTLKDLMRWIKTETGIPKEHQRIMNDWKGYFNYKGDKYLWVGSPDYKDNTTLRSLGLVNGFSFYCYEDPDVIMLGDV